MNFKLSFIHKSSAQQEEYENPKNFDKFLFVDCLVA